MLTKQLKKFCIGLMECNFCTEALYAPTVIDIDGVTKQLRPASYYGARNGNDAAELPIPMGDFINPTYRTTAIGTGIILGSNNTAPTENDYNLLDKIIVGLSVSANYVISNTDHSIEFNIAITNTSSSIIRIGEVGYQIKVTLYDTSNRSSTNAILVDRSVLSNIISLGPNELTVIRYGLQLPNY